MPVNRHVKSIVKCSDLLDATINPHEFQVKGPVCDTLGRTVAMTAIQPVACHAALVLNHYVTRSRQDWLAKLGRGSAMIDMKEPRYDPALFDHYAETCVIWDDAILRFAPAVRALLAEAPNRAAKRRRPEAPARLAVLAHIQGVGDADGRDGDWIGRRGSGRWIEGLCVTALDAGAVACRVVAADGSVSAWMPGGTYCGSKGLATPVHGFAVRLAGSLADQYACACQATFTDGSVCAPTDGICASGSLAPLEAIRIALHPRARRPARNPGPVLASQPTT